MAARDAKLQLAQQLAKRLKKKGTSGQLGNARPLPAQPIQTRVRQASPEAIAGGASPATGKAQAITQAVARAQDVSGSGVPPAPTGMKPGAVGMGRPAFKRKRRLGYGPAQSKAASFNVPE